MSAIEYAAMELGRFRDYEDEAENEMVKNITDIVKLFQSQRHSGFSANYAINILERLLRFKPVSPLTGEDDEWHFVYKDSDGLETYQNQRCSSVFKKVDENGNIIECYDCDAICMSDDGGLTWFTSKDTNDDITFPYMPPTHAKQIYIERDESEKGWHVVVDEDHIKQMRKEAEWKASQQADIFE